MEAALPPGRINEVRGYADTRLRIPADPMDPRNRRVSIVVSNQATGQRVVDIRGDETPVSRATGPGRGQTATCGCRHALTRKSCAVRAQLFRTADDWQ